MANTDNFNDLFADYNGECFVAGGSGEVEEMRAVRVVAVPPGMVAKSGAENYKRYVALFLAANYNRLLAFQYSTANAFKIAWIRTLAFDHEIFAPNDAPVQHNVRFRDFSDAIAPEVAREVPDAVLQAHEQWRREVRPKLTNIICAIAYMFRVRGHHFVPEMEARYHTLWRKCLYNEDDPGLGWDMLAHEALHAIYPDDLDDFWLDAAEQGNCAGTLIKRVSSLPAGIAGIAALNAGVSDLQLVVPRAFDYVPDALRHLADVSNKLLGNNNRWNGSVNRRFYGAADVPVNESLLASIASLILSSLEQFAPTSKLRDSAALKRIAGNAPMTGAVVAKMINTAVKSDVAAETFLPKPAAIAP